MADLPISGVEVYAQYGWETTYGSVQGTRDTAFGRDVRIRATPRNNLIQIQGLGDRQVKALLAGGYEGSLSINFMLGSTDWLRGVFGSISTTGAVNTYTQSKTIPSMSVEVGYDMGTTDVVRTFVGVKINSATITAAVGEPVPRRGRPARRTRG